MILEFFISGGRLRMPKKTFIREMLGPGSIIKQLLNYELHKGDKNRYLKIDRTSSKDLVEIRFNTESRASVGQDYKELLQKLKNRLKGELRGSVVLVADYYHQFSLTLNLDADDSTIIEEFGP